MIDVYKIGLSFYKDVDKNSGLYEYNLIKGYIESLTKLQKEKFNKKRMLLIINGLMSKEEEEYLLGIMSEYDKKVFIASDIVAIQNNKSILEKCDVLLHQCPKRNIKDIDIKQRYSYVPELFYFHNNYTTNEKNDILFFGGGVRDIEVQLKNIQQVANCNFLLKNSNEDNRLPYAEYLKLQSKHSYTLITCRKDYSNIGWITARFIECICNNNYPIVLDCYDKDDYFNIPKISNIEDIPVIINYLNTNDKFREEIICSFKTRFFNDRVKFVDTIEEIYCE